MISAEQKSIDNLDLNNGAVNRCAGTLQLAVISWPQLVTGISSLLVSALVWLFVSIEVAVLVFIVMWGTALLLGGSDFGRAYEKMTKTKTYYSEVPLKGIGKDGLPCALFAEEGSVLGGENGKIRMHSIERAFDALRFYGSYELEQADVGFYTLNKDDGPLCYFVYGFEVDGFSPCMDHSDCMIAIAAITKAFKNIPDLKLTFVWDLPADGSAQILQQKRLLDKPELDKLSKELARSRGAWAVKQEAKGKLVAPKLRVYARVKSLVGQEDYIPQDWKDQWAAKLAPMIERVFGDSTEQAMMIRSMDLAYESCCLPVMRAFNETIGMNIRPLTVHELYSYDYAQIHSEPVDKCPQYVRLTTQGVLEHEDMRQTRNGLVPIVPHHILGELFKPEGLPAVPAFYRTNIWLPLKGRRNTQGEIPSQVASCIRLKQMEGYSDAGGSHAVGHVQNVYRWMIGLSDVQFITNVEAVDPLPKKNQLDKAITQRTKLSNKAMESQGQDIDSSEDVLDLMEARRSFRNGDKTLCTATLIWVYANSKESLKLKQQAVLDRVGRSNCELVQDSIEQRWIDSQSYAWEAACMKPIMRRPEYLMKQTIPIIPFTQPQQLDSQGTGYVGAGIPTPYFIDFCFEKNHTFISAKSGGGKSMQGLEIMSQCIANEVPFVFLDSPPLADASKGEVAASTYTPAINNWKAEGVNCAYQDVKNQDFNILGRYGLGHSTSEIETLIATHIDTLLALVIGDNPRHPLKEDVINILSRSYRDFLQTSDSATKDPILVEYLQHFIDWSNRYQNGEIDLYSALGITSTSKFEPSEKEREAIGMIRSQLMGVLSQPWGKRINAQTSFDTDVMYLVLGLTNVKAGSKEGLVYSLATLAFMDRMTSRYDRSVAGMDEGTTLLPMEAFASKFSRLFPEGRKKGVNGILLATELSSLLNSPYCGDILDNFDNYLVGYSEKTSVRKFVEHLELKEEILKKYTKRPNLREMSSQWYLKRGDQHLELLYYTTPLLLGLGATAPKELKAGRIFRDSLGDMSLLEKNKLFGKKLYSAYSSGRGPNSILK